MEQNKLALRLSIVSIILSLLLMVGAAGLWRVNTSLKNELETIKSSRTQTDNSAVPAEGTTKQLEKDIAALKQEVQALKGKDVKTAAEPDKTLFYISKLGDKSFTSTYNQDYTWYIAAEELGKIGKPAIPLLIENLNTKDVYEKSLTFYALQLATQNDNVKAFTKGDYMDLKFALTFDEKDFDEMNKIVNDWWLKYKGNW